MKSHLFDKESKNILKFEKILVVGTSCSHSVYKHRRKHLLTQGKLHWSPCQKLNMIIFASFFMIALSSLTKNSMFVLTPYLFASCSLSLYDHVLLQLISNFAFFFLFWLFIQTYYSNYFLVWNYLHIWKNGNFMKGTSSLCPSQLCVQCLYNRKLYIVPAFACRNYFSF